MKIALLGNPNTGKSTVFNMLTGMRQHVGNFPGVTVDKKIGKLSISPVKKVELIDFPGTYSIYPRSKDEEIVYQVLTNPQHKDYPDLVLYVADSTQLERNLFFFSQIYDLGLPCIMLLNMSDLANKMAKEIQISSLEQQFPNAQFVPITARVKVGKDRILQAIENVDFGKKNNFFIENYHVSALNNEEKQENEALHRIQKIKSLMPSIESVKQKKVQKISLIDKIVTHKIGGYVIFTAILLFIFQMIFSFASIPMDFIDASFSSLAEKLAQLLPSGIISDLITQGIIPGIGGVVIFIPQIALLFFFIAILEESGYLSRVVFILDKIMRPLGLNGKSAVPLLSSAACAVPGIMSARTITNQKERLITILVAPLMSCSARIPVYTLLIALVIPAQKIGGIFQLQGLVLFGLYAIGLIAALFVAWILKMLIPSNEKSMLMLELPAYRAPILKNVLNTIWEKSKIFVLNAGKIILSISIILWAAATFGPGDKMEKAEKNALEISNAKNLSAEQTDELVASAKLENSYIGYFGRWIEPSIKPLGYDWKIGIALITSFAAREVFVGTLSTIYSVHDDSENQILLRERMQLEKKIDGTPVFTLASGVSLMLFYAFAMQCMSTVSVVKSETKSWKWPIIQFVFMGAMAYFSAWISYIILS